ncbi:MAG: dynamin family protein, partial [Nitrososphaerales archaeon]
MALRDLTADLLALTARLIALSQGETDLASRAARLSERISDQRFHLAVLGEFKRGKSTLVNALTGRDLLPSGVLPLTTVATEVHIGASHSSIVFTDGHEEPLDHSQISDYVTESRNPGNVKEIARVMVATPSSFGISGLVLIDTPGIGSVNEHNTHAAHAALEDSDGAVLVLSADSPLSEGELEMLSALADRHAKVFIVINKCDHLAPKEIDQVAAFVREHVDQVLSVWDGPYCIDARSALQGISGPGHSLTSRAYANLRTSLEAFVRDGLVLERTRSSVTELTRL